MSEQPIPKLPRDMVLVLIQNLRHRLANHAAVWPMGGSLTLTVLEREAVTVVLDEWWARAHGASGRTRHECYDCGAMTRFVDATEPLPDGWTRESDGAYHCPDHAAASPQPGATDE